MKIAAVIILYNPQHSFTVNLASFYDCVGKVYVLDNSKHTDPLVLQACTRDNIQYIGGSGNEGIAKRLNEACAMATRDGFDWLLTMDQDTFFPDSFCGCYLKAAMNFNGLENVAMFGTAYGRAKQLSASTACTEDVSALITSGSLLNLHIYKSIGQFDENLFIDSVDHEYCVRARLEGHRLVRFNNIYLTHEIGTVVNRSCIKSLFLIRKKKIVHNPLRCYYMYRNMLYLEKLYAGRDMEFARLIRQYVSSYVQNYLLYGRQSYQLVRYLERARTDFRNGNMGRIREKD